MPTDTKVSALTDGTTAEATDRIPVARDAGGGTFNNRYVTPAYIKTLTLSGTMQLASSNVYIKAGDGNNLYIGNNGSGATSQYGVAVRPLSGESGLRVSYGIAIGQYSQDAYQDLFLTRADGAKLQLGAADAAAPVAQTLQVQSVVAGTSNTAGTNWTLKGSAGTGTGAGGSIIFQVAPAGSSGSAQNTLSTALTIVPNGGIQIKATSSVQSATFAMLDAANSRKFILAIPFEPSGSIYSSQIGDPCFRSDTPNILFGTDAAGSLQLGIKTDYVVVPSTSALVWNNVAATATNAMNASTFDLRLYRDTNDTLALRRPNSGATSYPQTFNVYNTYTDASNYERGFARWSSNIFQIGLEKAGTGTDRQINIISSSIGGEGAVTISGPSGGNTNVKVTGALQNTTTMIVGQLLRWGGFTADANNTVLDGRSNKMLLFLDGNQTSGAGAELIEMTAPAAPSANRVRIYAEDNGSGKTRLMALFATGAAQQIAIEP